MTKEAEKPPEQPGRPGSRSMTAAKELERERIAAVTPFERASLALALGRRLVRLREAQAGG